MQTLSLYNQHHLTDDNISSDADSDSDDDIQANSESDSDSDDDIPYYRRRHLTLTENNSATYKTSTNPCLDFFFHIVPNTSSSAIINRLNSSWSHNPLMTLKLICNLRSVRGTGKSDKQSFYTAALWLQKHYPKTLAMNIAALVQFGYFKDLLEILYRLIQGPEVRKVAKSEWMAKKSVKG